MPLKARRGAALCRSDEPGTPDPFISERQFCFTPSKASSISLKTFRRSISEETLLFLAESGIASITSFAVPMICLPLSTGVVAFFMFSENPATLLTALMPVNVCPYASLPSKRIAERKSAEDDEKPDIDSSLSAIVEFGSVILLMNASPFM